MGKGSDASERETSHACLCNRLPLTTDENTSVAGSAECPSRFGHRVLRWVPAQHHDASAWVTPGGWLMVARLRGTEIGQTA